jgi:hypothetical protein
MWVVEMGYRCAKDQHPVSHHCGYTAFTGMLLYSVYVPGSGNRYMCDFEKSLNTSVHTV